MSESESDPRWQRTVTIGIMFLAFASGCADVATYMQLGHVFASAVTGSTALLGLALSRGQWLAVAHAGSAVGGFTAGCFIAALIHGHRKQDEVRAHDIYRLCFVEALILGGFVLAWQELPHPLPHLAVYGLIIISAASMGMQNVTARQIHVPSINTVVLNNTLTNVVVSLVSSPREVEQARPPRTDVKRQGCAVFLSYIIGALSAGGVATGAAVITGVLPLVAVLIVFGLFFHLAKRHGR